MKAALNGVPQLSTLDGWWAEGYDGPNGWAIPPAPAGQDADAADAEQLYRLLENEVVPLFYDRDAQGVPSGWVERKIGRASCRERVENSVVGGRLRKKRERHTELEDG